MQTICEVFLAWLIVGTVIALLMGRFLKSKQPPKTVWAVCWHCKETHTSGGEYCPACRFAVHPDGIIWIEIQQRVDEVQSWMS